MSFEDLGARLRELRQSRGYQLEDAAKQIKLSERTLASIEEGRQNDLPHTVYAKGFVRTYARFLGMSDEEITEGLADAFPMEEEDNVAPIKVLHQPKRQKGTWGTLVILFILAALAVGGWFLYSNVFSENNEPPAAPAVQSSSESDEDDARSRLAAAEVPEEVVGEAAPSAGSNEVPDTDVAVNATEEPVNTALEAADNSDVTGPIYFESGSDAKENELGRAQPSVTSPGKKHRVVITATQECWIKAITDKGDERPFNLPKNQSSVFTFDKFLKLRLGNVAGVKIRYNGRDFPVPPGANTRDLVFPPQYKRSTGSALLCPSYLQAGF
ncbi:MAG: helix-turn-helix domain-containing protein [Desulfovibrionaceae bacterium]|nr:helix-turn-helix domain-containing protein [Desulfovibrionaceae bacterium]